MQVKSEISGRSPSWLRFLQVGLGVIAVGLALSVIVYPSVGVATVSVVLAAALIVVGVERLIRGFSTNQSSRVGNIILGVLVLGLGAGVLAFPLLATGFLVILLGIGLLFAGIARIIEGASSKHVSKGSRALSLGVGTLAVAISFMVFASPLLGVVFLNFIVAIGLTIIGIECIAQAISGRRSITSRNITP